MNRAGVLDSDDRIDRPRRLRIVDLLELHIRERLPDPCRAVSEGEEDEIAVDDGRRLLAAAATALISETRARSPARVTRRTPIERISAAFKSNEILSMVRGMSIYG